MNMRNKLASFMYGRNGMDALYYFILGILGVLMIVNAFLHWIALILIEFLLLVYLIFRVLSKNTRQRQRENARFLQIKRKLIRFFKLQKAKIRDRKTHVFKACPICKAVLRLPKTKGTHTVRCPRCQQVFDVKI
jgi:uncharacterized C2H2 Zn-finger protein